jgi:nicotinate phosphoribosyltransferase
MKHLRSIYQTRLTMLTDLYQLTMAHGYWKLGRADQEAVFHLFFRKSPFEGGYAVAAGLSQALDLLSNFQFDQSDIDYLATLTGNNGEPLFESEFLDYLLHLEFSSDVDAVPEGKVVFANEPLIRIKGPILQGQILESALLNAINFQTLIATKAARICTAAGGDDVIEMGLRRAQGIDGSLSASRAAYIGGCAGTSNVLAGKLYNIPVRGTLAHSWVMSFDEEIEAFERFAETMPNNCVFLVDTYDTVAGVRAAIDVGHRLRERGHEMIGVRLDSGDLAYLSVEARRLLDSAGFEDAVIVASNDLDEYIIQDLKFQGATIAVWGVGTKLAASFDQPALGGVYKLGATRNEDGTWKPCVKLSEQKIKTSIPGILQVRRFEDEFGCVADMIYDELTKTDGGMYVIDPNDPTRKKKIPKGATSHDLLVPVARKGEIVFDDEPIDVIRDRARTELAKLHPGMKRMMNPHEYPVGLEPKLSELRDRMIDEARAVEEVF